MRYVLLLVLVVVAACGGDDGNSDGNNGNPDAKVFEDAPPMQMDAPPNMLMGLGQACTPVQGSPQADCPVGFECLSLTGGSGAWCSKTCTQGAGDTCAMGYMGPGLASCVYSITDGNMQTRTFCGIICESSQPAQCPATQCNGMCPAPLMCSANLMNGQGMAVGKACF